MTNNDIADAMDNKINQMAKGITIVADSNIASLNDFFNHATLGQLSGQTVKIIPVAGRDIDATLCLCPPDNSFGRLSKSSSIFKIFAASFTFEAISSFGLFSIFNPNDIFSNTFM